MARTPTVEDVARAAGVSRQTVSNVLNNPGIVRRSTQEKVLNAVKELGYRPHTAARQLRTRRSSAIGVHLDPYRGGISGVMLDRFVHALTERATARAMRVLVYTARDVDEEIRRIEDLVDGGEIDAVVLSGTRHQDPRTTWLHAHGIPFASFGRPWGATRDAAGMDAHPWVDVDSAVGTELATRHALENGARRITFLGWPAGSGTGDDRERGWLRALEEAGGVAPGERLAVDDDVTAARLAVAAVLAGDGTDAVVCASDVLAIGAHLAGLDAGRPELLIYGFDNTPTADALGISSVEQQPERVASAVLDQLMGPDGTSVRPQAELSEGRHVLVVPELVVRSP
ncbi:LacI family DNA-binding transcriptional regulator [Nesterenkonia sp. CL21]|uniref:LacI family DNA-binding transcriptional regulator n=1 Tax=Nesterenkonia sp. CL21 TaxID=3064894 RepID=UPI00287A5407|nr:LacI family DNA-binding transcriptional regulator [Nesterenkonia sp. CL21]MDS2172966.1 LacI family DNA-binding transcriptional regulator [Nesterenkonia sp. CL21]